MTLIRNPDSCSAAALLDTVSDPDFRAAHTRLLAMHAEKSATYGSDHDRLANFNAVSAVVGRAPEVYALERIIEKSTRAIHMIAGGSRLDVAEYMDIAGLALCAQALLARATRAADPD